MTDCAICGGRIRPPVKVYDGSGRPVCDDCLDGGLDNLSDVLGFD